MKRILLVIIVLAAWQAQAQVNFTFDGLMEMDVFGTHATGVVDVNGDGLDDIVALDEGDNLVIYFQEENGNMTLWNYGPISSDGGWGGWAWGLCMADIDKNGLCDVLAGGSYDGIKIGLVNETSDDITITEAPGYDIFLQGVNFFDINNDGHIDVFACHDDGPSKILLNDGMGALTYDEATNTALLHTAIMGEGEDGSGNYGTTWSDVNGDNHGDLYIAKCRQGVVSSEDPRRINQLWIYDPATNSYFEDAEARGVAIGAQSWAAELGDIDNDGDMDMFVGNHDLGCQILLNDGTGHFEDITVNTGMNLQTFPFAVIECIFRDFDNDGWIDLLVSGGNQYVMAYNNGDNTFDFVSDNIDYPLNSFAVGDLNTDGFVDIYGVAGGYGAWGADDIADGIMMNDGNANHYLMVDLEGVESNLDGIGAKIVIETAAGTQVREIRSGESYGIMNSMIAHFGLGSETEAESITVYWPSGIIDDIANVDADQTVGIQEGSDAVNVAQTTSVVTAVYPNPTNDNVTVMIDKSLRSGTMTLTNSLGQVVVNQSLNGISVETLDLNALPAGTYALSLINGSIRSKEMIVKL